MDLRTGGLRSTVGHCLRLIDGPRSDQDKVALTDVRPNNARPFLMVPDNPSYSAWGSSSSPTGAVLSVPNTVDTKMTRVRTCTAVHQRQMALISKSSA